ncbi:hypothetical protein C8R43DRAFT_964545 [Mycena crocata]|nr:hypothetical protein C8R43DRAFT_964545 [Mycena crocata]
MTTRRPPLTTQRLRPSSQVYIGPDSAFSSYLSSPPDLPDLPEPPSPGSSSSTSTSGLPSPPATNSTGSGSTGDPGSIAVRGGANMLNGSNIKTFHAAFQSVGDHHDDEQDDFDNDIDDDGEDNTARLDQRRHSASENVSFLTVFGFFFLFHYQLGGVFYARWTIDMTLPLHLLGAYSFTYSLSSNIRAHTSFWCSVLRQCTLVLWTHAWILAGIPTLGVWLSPLSRTRRHILACAMHFWHWDIHLRSYPMLSPVMPTLGPTPLALLYADIHSSVDITSISNVAVPPPPRHCATPPAVISIFLRFHGHQINLFLFYFRRLHWILLTSYLPAHIHAALRPQALDKLSSFSRLSSPSPSTRPANTSTSTSRSPHPPASSSSGSNSNSNKSYSASNSHSASNTSNSASSSSHSHSHSTTSTRPSIRRARTQDHRSGSETERDEHDDDDLPTTTRSPHRPTTPLPRQRLVSAPASPQKGLAAIAASSSSGSGSSTRSPRRARVSNLSFSSTSQSRRTSGYNDFDGEGGPSSPEEAVDITRAALAAVASARGGGGGGGTARYTGGTGTRMSPTYTGGARMSPTSTGSGKRRQPIPREWGAGSTGGSNGRFSTEPPTSPPQHQTSPNKRHSLAGSTASVSSSQHSRGHTHSNSTSSTSTIGSTVAGRERASVRELARRHQTRWMSEDMGNGSNGGGSSNGAAMEERERERERERRQSLRAGSAESALGAGRSLVGEGLRAAGLAVRTGDVFSPPERERTPQRVEWAEDTRSRSQTRVGGHGRAATSMADYASPRRREDEYGRDGDGDDGEPRTAPMLRTYRSSAYVLDGGAGPSGARAGSALGRYRDRDRGVSVERDGERHYAPSPSPFGSVRRHGGGGGGGSGQQEHTKLMGDSLAIFEGHLARVSGGGGPADLARSAQALVGAADRLNAILRAGTARALEEQIDAEVSGVDSGAAAAELAEVWRRVGGEYREGLRVSDELVRGVTGFLLGVGRVVRDFGDGRGSDEGRGSASPETGRDGRRSAESRRSWEAKDDRRISTGGRDSAPGVRPSSVLNTRHEPAAPPPRNVTPSLRRLLTPREQRELNASGGIMPSDSQETIQQGGQKYEPSPTPASRKQNQGTLDRSRTLPPISIPKPLPTLPSEATSTLRRNLTTGDRPGGNSQQRRRTLTSSTVRAAGAGLLPSMTTPTTALTPHTVSNSPHERGDARMTFPAMPRNDSDKSVTTRSRTNTVTFSRPSTVALAGLQMQHNRERQRTISGTNGPDEQRAAASAAGPSGSEAEKDTRKRSVASRDRPRMSLDGGVESTGHAADRSAAAALGLNPTLNQKRERRRTVTDIWPPSGS